MNAFYPVKLEHQNLVPGSETVTIAGGQFVVLVRDVDYTIDYKNGILSINIEGAAAMNLRPDEDLPLDVNYRYQVNFDEEVRLESHIEVVGEIANVVDLFELSVQNTPVTDVFRVFNRTTREEYALESFLNDRIFINGENPPRVAALDNQSSVLRDRVFATDKFQNTIGLTLPESFGPAVDHPLSSVDSIDAVTLYRQLIQGGVDSVQSEYVVEITTDVANVELITGSTILRRSSNQLILDTDYTLERNAEGTELSIFITSVGMTKIGNNSLFYRLTKVFTPLSNEVFLGDGTLKSEHRIDFDERFMSEVVAFLNGTAQLTKFVPFMEVGQEVDQLVFPPIVVTNQTGTIGFVQGEDYVIDVALQRLIRIDTSTRLDPNQVVKVSYVDEESFAVDANIVRDVIAVDYHYGNNSLDWTPGIEDTQVEEEVELKKGVLFFTLRQFPVDENVQVLLEGEGGVFTEVPVRNVDLATRRVSIEGAPRRDTYVVRYTARSQVFDPGSSYFCSYSYGARKRALVDNWAALLGLDTGTVARAETFDLINNQSSQALADQPISIEDVLIYLTGDPDKSPLSTATAFDSTNNVLEFTPILSAGNYTIEYTVSGFQTEQLRTAILALIQAFITGPTKLSVENIGAAFTRLTPLVVESINNGFNLTNDETSDFLSPLEPETSPALSNGASSIEFEPSRFANGLSLKSANGTYVGYSALSNIRVEEGTVEFLFGNRWDGDDGQSHQFFDVRGTGDFTNRITCYKNKQGLLAFEVHDKNSRLFRATTDVTRLPRNEIRFLNAGDSTTQLTFAPAYTIEDLNANEQSDIFEANRTEFVIAPIFSNLEGLGLNIATIVQIPNDLDYTDEPTFILAADKLRTLAGIYANNGARLTIQSESAFMEGCSLYDNVLLDLVINGHDVHLFIDFPADVISDEDRQVYILERRNKLAALGIAPGDSDGIAGGYEVHDFATVYPELGLDFASAYVNPITGDTIEDRTDVFRASTDSDFTVPDPEGQFVFIPGDATIDFQTNPMIVQSFIPITNALLSAIAKAKPDVINSWYFVVGLNEFTSTEASILFDSWLKGDAQDQVDAGRATWRTLSEIFRLFREFEEFINVNRNRVRFVTSSYGAYDIYGYGGLQEIRALSWDNVTKTLTFDPVDETGFYLFSYISGFSKYEEAEHFVTCNWKLHTDDGQPAFTKLYLDGELVNHKVWGDL